MTSSDRSLNATFVIITGITGPPASGTDSAHAQALNDARGYAVSPRGAGGGGCHVQYRLR